MKRKKILFIYYQNIKQNGISKSLANLTGRLVGEGYDVSILFLMEEHPDFFEIDKRVKKIYINSFDTFFYNTAVNIKNKGLFKKYINKIIMYFYDFGCFFLLKKWIKRNHAQYNTIITCWYKLSSYLSLMPVANKTVAWEHIGYKTGGIIYFQILRKYYARLYGIVTLTEDSINHYKNINKNTVIISNIIGEDFENYKLNISEKDNHILVASRLDPEKNVEEFLHILNLANIPTSWSVTIAGDGQLKNTLIQRSNELGIKNIKFIGSVNTRDMINLYRKSKIFCMTSLVEGLPTTLIEAMFLGNALISYDCPTGPSEIINDKNGFLIPLHDKVSFAEKLLLLTNKSEFLEGIIKTSYAESENWKENKIMQKWKIFLL